MYTIQEKVIFYPDPVPETQSFGVGQEVEIKLEEELSMNCLWIRSKKSKGVVLYFHGNKGNVPRAIYQTRIFKDKGYDVFIPDYRSYGKTEGKLESAKQLESDALKAYEFLMEHYPEKDIAILGYSLGTGMASSIAAVMKPKVLILLAPFVSIAYIKNKYLWFLPDFLLRFNLRNDIYLQKVNCPVTIIHGTADRVVPYECSPILQKMNPDKITLKTLEGESHRRVIFSRQSEAIISRLLD